MTIDRDGSFFANNDNINNDNVDYCYENDEDDNDDYDGVYKQQER